MSRIRWFALPREHHSSRDGTLQVLAGRIRLPTGTQTLNAVAGDLLTVPADDHTLSAVEDSAVLLTVGLTLGKPDPAAVVTIARSLPGRGTESSARRSTRTTPGAATPAPTPSPQPSTRP
jgi:hypothetical protein